jgi:hypothetical protein
MAQGANYEAARSLNVDFYDAATRAANAKKGWASSQTIKGARIEGNNLVVFFTDGSEITWSPSIKDAEGVTF